MGPSRTDYSRKIDYSAIQNGEASLKDAVLRLVKGIRGPRKNPIHLLDILAWFRGAPIEMTTKALQELRHEGAVINVQGGFRIKTFGDVVKGR